MGSIFRSPMHRCVLPVHLEQICDTTLGLVCAVHATIRVRTKASTRLGGLVSDPSDAVQFATMKPVVKRASRTELPTATKSPIVYPVRKSDYEIQEVIGKPVNPCLLDSMRNNTNELYPLQARVPRRQYTRQNAFR